MEAILTVRLDETTKKQGSKVMQEFGYTPSMAVRELFEYAVKHDALPFNKHEKPSKSEIKKRIALFDACHTKEPIQISDDEIRVARLEERYGFDAR